MKEYLDRCFVPVKGVILFPRAIVNHISTSASDHNAICLLMEGHSTHDPHAGKRFHFKLVWIGEVNCEKFVEEEWNSFDSRIVTTKEIISEMSRCAKKMMRWNKFSFNHIKSRVQEFYHLLGDFRSRSPSVENVRCLHQVENEIDCLLYKEESQWKQRSWISWLCEGDRNTNFFHNHACACFPKNYIRGIIDKHGNWITNPQGATDSFLSFYQKLFTSLGSIIGENLSYSVRGRVMASMNTVLCKPFTIEEIKISLFQMHTSKAPGYDGLLAFFYQNIGDWLVIN